MTTTIGNLVDVSTIREIVSLAKDTIARSKALHELRTNSGS
jgi:hypothetical protein